MICHATTASRRGAPQLFQRLPKLCNTGCGFGTVRIDESHGALLLEVWHKSEIGNATLQPFDQFIIAHWVTLRLS